VIEIIEFILFIIKRLNNITNYFFLFYFAAIFHSLLFLSISLYFCFHLIFVFCVCFFSFFSSILVNISSFIYLNGYKLLILIYKYYIYILFLLLCTKVFLTVFKDIY